MASPFDQLDDRTVADFLVQVGSQSFDHFDRMRSVCRRFARVALDFGPHIMHNVSLNNVPYCRTWGGPRARGWYQMALLANNPQANFKEGLATFHTISGFQLSYHYLRKAVASDYEDAYYAYGIISLYGGHREQGLRVLDHFKLDVNADVALTAIVKSRERTRAEFMIALAPRNWMLHPHPNGGLGRNLRGCNNLHCPARDEPDQWHYRRNNNCTCFSSCFWDNEAKNFFEDNFNEFL